MKKINISLVTFLFLFIHCKEDNESGNTTDFNTTAMIEDLTHIILKDIDIFVSSVNDLSKKIETFEQNPIEYNLEEARNSWIETSKAYETLFSYNLGKAKELFLHQLIYNWPVFSIAIENAISSEETINITTISSNAKGLTGIEYLLYGNEGESLSDAILKFQSNPKRMQYLYLCVQNLKEQAARLQSTWSPQEENYAFSFINNQENGLQSSLNMIFNAMFNVIETIKKAKLGKPAGLENGSNPDPELLQAYRSKNSLQLIKKNFESVRNLYFNTEGLGISDNVAAISGSELINDRIKIQFDQIDSCLDQIQNPLAIAVIEEKEKVRELYEHITNLSMLFNNEAGSTLSIIITPTDNDGD